MTDEKRSKLGLALVTGASSGLGVDFARELAGRGFDLILVARRMDRLEELAGELRAEFGIEAHSFSADLADPAGPARLVDQLETAGLHPDFLVNNAGMGQWGPYLNIDADHEHQMVMVNVVGLTRLTRLIVPGMARRGRGRVLNVSSTAAFFPGPLMTVYYASKAYVLSFSVGLDEELRDKGVTVTCLCSGPIETEFSDIADQRKSKLFDNSAVMPTQEVAKQGVDAALRGERIRTPGVTNKLSTFSSRFFPRVILAKAVKIIQGPKDVR